MYIRIQLYMYIMYIYIYILYTYIHMYIYIHACIYIGIQEEVYTEGREDENSRDTGAIIISRELAK